MSNLEAEPCLLLDVGVTVRFVVADLLHDFHPPHPSPSTKASRKPVAFRRVARFDVGIYGQQPIGGRENSEDEGEASKRGRES